MDNTRALPRILWVVWCGLLVEFFHLPALHYMPDKLAQRHQSHCDSDIEVVSGVPCVVAMSQVIEESAVGKSH